MLAITVGIGLTLFLLGRSFAIRQQTHDMGTMSQQWVVLHHASQPASSI